MWATVDPATTPPSIDLSHEMAVSFAEGVGSSCPDLLLDDVVIDPTARWIYDVTKNPLGDIPCTADLTGTVVFVVALQRTALPDSPFTIALDAPDVCAGPGCAAVQIDLTNETSPSASASAALPSPSFAPTPTAWIPITTTGGVTPHWSPDGNYLLLEEQDTSDLVLLGADGRRIGSYDGFVEPTWLTGDQFVAYKASTMPSNPHREAMTAAIIGKAGDGSTADATFPCCDALGNGHGAATASWFLPNLNGVEQPQFGVWSDGALTDPQPGFPVAWSAAGDKLVIAHPFTQGPPTAGWMEVFAWPGPQSVLKNDRATAIGPLTSFDPSDNYVAYGDVDVVELATGDVTRIPTEGNHTSFAWEAQDDVLVSDAAGLTTYSTDGTKLGFAPFSGWITGSADGSTVLMLDSNNVMTVWPSGDTIALPTVPESETTFWLSPTGKGLFVMSNGGSWLTQLP